MTTNQILFEVAAEDCRCRTVKPDVVRGVLGAFAPTSPVTVGEPCDPCRARRILVALQAAYTDGAQGFANERYRVACNASADYIAARDSDDLEIPDCEEE